MEKHKPYVKRIQVSGGKTAAKMGHAFGQAMDAALEFLRDRRIVAWEIVAERIVFVRGRGKRLTRVSKTVRDRLVVTMAKPETVKMAVLMPSGPGADRFPTIPVVDRRAGRRPPPNWNNSRK